MIEMIERFCAVFAIVGVYVLLSAFFIGKLSTHRGTTEQVVAGFFWPYHVAAKFCGLFTPRGVAVVLALVILFGIAMLSGCSHYDQSFRRASGNVTAGAPYYRGSPGGSDLQVQTQRYDYRVQGSRSFGGTTR